MSRMIDADALIPMMKYATTDSEIGVFPIKIGFNDIEKVINEQPTIEPEPHWIPCSERLPEDDTLMLVNYVDHRPDAMDIWIGWHEMENVWYIDGEEHSEERGNEVIAWMPLPESYKDGEG